MFGGDSDVFSGFARSDESFIALWAITVTPTLMFWYEAVYEGFKRVLWHSRVVIVQKI